MSWARFAPRPKQLLLGVVVALVASAALVGFAYARTSIPSPSTIASAQTTTLYYSDGHTVLARVGTTNRTDVPLSQVPVTVQHAVLAAEDRHFYSEPGISPTGILRALFVDLRGGDITQGGSTITQQYAKNAYLSAQRSFTRKIKEIFIATKLGQTRSKATILDDYLNTIYFGRNAYGIQAASKAYFHRDVSDLTTSQGALLAAVINGPSLYDPRINPTASRSRWHYVVDGMVTEHWLSSKRAKRLHFPATKKPNVGQGSCSSGPRAFICNAVRDELVNHDGITEAQWELGGLKVVTTINKTAQAAAVSAENTFVGNKHGRPESGLVSVKPGDGAIEALYGGAEYCRHQSSDDCVDLTGEDSNYARPPGSSMKPYTLIAALKQGISLNTVFPGPSHISFPGAPTGISNAGGEVCGQPCTLVRALAESINTVFVPLAQQVGPDKVDQVAYDSGIPTSAKLSTFPEVSLGTEPVSVLDQAVGYATIAAQGIAASPYIVASVKSADGSTIYRSHPSTHRAYSASVGADATYAMTKVLQCSWGGTACGKALTGRPAAGKTGTTTDNTNAWFIGFTPQLSTAVWLGNDTKHSHLPVTSGGLEIFGGDIPAKIWQSMMNAALAAQPVIPFPAPSQVVAPVSPTPTSSKSASPSTGPSTSPSVSPTESVSPTVTPTILPTITPSGSPTASASPAESAKSRRRR